MNSSPCSVVSPFYQEGWGSCREFLSKLSLQHPAVIILKGHITYICQNGQIFYNTNGNAGMTKGGTGDVLAGLLAALLTKNNPLTATAAAVYVNGKAEGINSKRNLDFITAPVN